jgi:hypothetical protein
MSESKKKVKCVPKTHTLDPKVLEEKLLQVVKERNFPAELYDVWCNKMQDELKTYLKAHVCNEYTQQPANCMTSTIRPGSLNPVFQMLACVCTRFRDVLKKFRAGAVEFVVADINSELLLQCKRLIFTAIKWYTTVDMQWELMFQEKCIYSIRVCTINGFLIFYCSHQEGGERYTTKIQVEKVTIKAATEDSRRLIRDDISNRLMDDLQTWQSLSHITHHDLDADRPDVVTYNV